MAEDKPTILFIAGPGGTAFDSKDTNIAIENFRKAGANVVVVGDGKKDISLSEINTAAAQIKGPMTTFAWLHGEVKNDKHCIGLTEECNTPTQDFFTQLTKARGGKRSDVFMVACNGGAAQADANEILPKGSVFVDLAPGHQTVAGSDVKQFTQTLAENKQLTGNMSAENLLNDYLMTDLENRIPPSITVAGEGTYVLDSILKDKIAKKFTPEEKAKVHKTLDASFGPDKVSSLINKIESARSDEDLHAVTEFGPALAVAFAAYDRSQGGMHFLKDFKLPNIQLKENNGTNPFDEGFNKDFGNMLQSLPISEIGRSRQF